MAAGIGWLLSEGHYRYIQDLWAATIFLALFHEVATYSGSLLLEVYGI